MDYRELDLGELFEAGDWWAFEPTGLDDRMTFTAPNWFDHPTLGKCFRMDHRIARQMNTWAGLPDRQPDDTAVFRETFEDF